jgi:predicted adenine nucleotide alpha hydrolase (AANH) superfamily ATPase
MKVVLHICCGVCAASVAERLSNEGHEVYGFFYNPNIYPEEEYKLRLEAAHQVADELHFPLQEGPYLPEEWAKETISLENEPEGGRRCEVCFRIRLRKTYLYLLDVGGDVFTTTLTVSPHKPASVVNRIGNEIGSGRFLASDFKKKDGFRRATELARKWNLYHQNYCGCRYSLKKAANHQ